MRKCLLDGSIELRKRKICVIIIIDLEIWRDLNIDHSYVSSLIIYFLLLRMRLIVCVEWRNGGGWWKNDKKKVGQRRYKCINKI